jgi:hypothetical protein
MGIPKHGPSSPKKRKTTQNEKEKKKRNPDFRKIPLLTKFQPPIANVIRQTVQLYNLQQAHKKKKKNKETDTVKQHK